MSTRFCINAVVVSLVVLLAGSQANGQTIWYVNAASPCPGSGTQADPFCTIQAAINAAAANATPPDEIHVADGIYTGTGNKNLDFGGKKIKLIGVNGPANCIIDCQGDGRGFYFHTSETAESVVDGITIRNGYVTSYGGGGVYCQGSSPTLINCIISGNQTGGQARGGGVCCRSSAQPALINCTISDNASSAEGGGMYCLQSSPTLTGIIAERNTSAGAGAGMCFESRGSTLTNCTITGNSTGPNSDGGGIYASSIPGTSALQLIGCTISANTAQYSGGGVCLESCSNSVLTNCIIAANTVPHSAGAGGGICCYSSSVAITGCIIYANSIGGSATSGGLYLGGNNSSLTNCLIAANSSAETGGGITCAATGLTITNCTITGNTATVAGGALYSSVTSTPRPVVTNSILWGNAPNEVYYTNASYSPTLTYCDVQRGYTGTGNVDVNPLFVDPDGADDDPATYADNDFRLSPGSPCIDIGTNSPSGGLPSPDPYGVVRPQDGDSNGSAVADLGAYEALPQAAPVIALDQITVVFAIPAGETADQVKSMSIKNGGPGTLHWTLTEAASWLTADPLLGESSGEWDAVSLRANAAGLLPGLHSTTLEVSDPLAVNTPVTVAIELHVLGEFHVPTEYSTIQDAIDAAFGQGDEVIVADGTYSGPRNRDLDFHGKAITVRSESGNPAACIIDCQNSGRGFYFHSFETATSVVDGFTITNGHPPSGNNAGGMYLSCSSPTITNCDISGNTAMYYAGFYCLMASSPTFINCSLRGNTNGAGAVANASTATFTNCLIADNTGGGLTCKDSALVLTNCTVSHNTSTSGGIYGTRSSGATGLTIKNCIVWENTPKDIATSGSVTVVVNNSDVVDGYSGTGNTSADPMFVDPDGPDKDPATWADNNYRILTGSPCIDTASNAAVPAGLLVDLDGNARVIDGNGDANAVVDMGAYEFVPHTAPFITVESAQLHFTVPEGQTGGRTRMVSIRNAGTGTLEWSLEGGDAWLQADTSEGQSTGEVNVVTLTASALGLARGSYSTTLQVTDPLATNSPYMLTVALDVVRTLHVPGDYATIQAAITAATPRLDEILVADQVYTGEGNKNLNFQGKAITVRSESGNPATCIIDCEGSGRGFYFASRETALSVVQGFTIRNGRVSSSSPGSYYGGAIFCSSSSPVFSDCIVTGNTTDGPAGSAAGGGVYCTSSHPTLVNCIIASNTSYAAAGLCCVASRPKVINSTFAGNVLIGSGTMGGGLLCSSYSTPRLTNCIAWGDLPNEIRAYDSEPIVTYCDVAGGYTGNGNIDADPQFVSPSEFSLLSGSPCIDVGVSDPAGGLPSLDVAGHPRILDGNGDGQASPDMGASEYDPRVPMIGATPARITFTILCGETDSATTVLPIKNDGVGTLHWTLTESASWLEADPVQGESTGEIDLVTLTASAVGLSHGLYTTVLQISDPAAGNDPILVEAILRVVQRFHVPTEYLTIQAAIDATTVDGDEVLLADSTYSGPGNMNLDFHGKDITLRSESGNPTACIIDCEGSGRGFYFHSGETEDAVVEGLTIRNGSASDGYGGGVLCTGDAAPSFIHCVITNNTVGGTDAYAADGGGVYAYSGIKLVDCTISGNEAYASDSDGYATADGGGVYCRGPAVLTNCLISGNEVVAQASDYSTVFASASAYARGGGVYCGASSVLTNCVVIANHSSASATALPTPEEFAYATGGVYTASAARVVNCIIGGNTAHASGWAEAVAVGGEAGYGATMTNCTLSGNSATEWTSSPVLAPGGAYGFGSKNTTLTNCILWGDTDVELGGNVAVTYSDVQGGQAGTGNISVNPLFADAEYRLAAGSPCIDTGNSTFLPSPGNIDLDGHFRVWDGDGNGVARVDMGAYEYGAFAYGDANCSGVEDGVDIQAFVTALLSPSGYAAAYPGCNVLVADLNGDQAVDLADVTMFVNLLIGE